MLHLKENNDSRKKNYVSDYLQTLYMDGEESLCCRKEKKKLDDIVQSCPFT